MNILSNIGNLDDFQIILKQLNDYLTDFFGFEYKIIMDTKKMPYIEFAQENKAFLIPYVEESYSQAVEIVNSEIRTHFCSKETFINDMGYLINKIATSLIFKTTNLDTEMKQVKTQNFIKILQDISNMTYESEPVKMGIFYCETNDDLGLLKNNNDFSYIKMNGNDLKKFICSQKPLLKMIDNKNFAIVINKNFEVVGIIKRKSGNKPILNIMNTRIRNKEKNLFINDLIDEIKYMTKVQFSDDFCEKFIQSYRRHKGEIPG